jgi:hypothetical protein
MKPSGIEPATFRILAQCSTTSVTFWLITHLGRKCIVFCVTEICITFFTRGHHYPLFYGRCQQVITSFIISLRSILILSSILLIFPPRCVYASGITGKFVVLFSWLLYLPHVPHSSSSIQPTVRLEPPQWLFPKVSKKIFVVSSTGWIELYILTFGKGTLAFSRKVCNQLPSNVHSYNRRKCRLFVQLW